MSDSETREELLRRLEARGKEAHEQLLASTEPHYIAEVAANVVGTDEADLVSMRENGEVFAWKDEKGQWRYPSLQFEDEGVVDGLSEVLDEFEGSPAGEVLLFLVCSDPRLKGRTPIQALRDGDVDKVVGSASLIGEHGGR